MGKITYGIKHAGYALIDSTDPQNPIFEVPKMLLGAKNAAMSVEQATNKIYADDKVHCVVLGAKVRELEMTFVQLSHDYVVDALGKFKNANGMVTDTGVKKRHCLFFVTTENDCGENTETPIIHYFYDVTGQEPQLETASKEEEVEANELVFTYECVDSNIAKDDNGKPAQYGYIVRTELNAVLFDSFMSSIILPTSIVTPPIDPEVI